MSQQAPNHYDRHRQRGFAGKSGELYLFQCVCNWNSGYLPLDTARQALADHIEDPTGDCR